MRWQDSYRVGDKVEVLIADGWYPAVVVRKTKTGQPEIRTQTANPSGLGGLSKTELRRRTVDAIGGKYRFAWMPARKAFGALLSDGEYRECCAMAERWLEEHAGPNFSFSVLPSANPDDGLRWLRWLDSTGKLRMVLVGSTDPVENAAWDHIRDAQVHVLDIAEDAVFGSNAG